MENFFIVVGFLVCVAILLGGIMLFVGWLFSLIKKYKRSQQIKHRFDKPPTAKCYCKDCSSYNLQDGRCYAFEIQYVADNWFCWKAEPKK